MFQTLLDELQRILTPLALAAFTAFVAYAFTVVRSWLGVVESDSNELEIRRAAATEAGKLIATQALDQMSIESAASKILADLPDAIKAEGYTRNDLADMVVSNLPAGFSQIASALLKGTK